MITGSPISGDRMITTRALFSKLGLVLGGGFLILAALVWAFHIYSVTHNAANSGESGILLLPFVFPWFFLVHGEISDSVMWLIVGFNSLLLYVFGCLLGWVAFALEDRNF